jgi:DNA invertase Pin-like site-specific DNA recombinase
MKTYGYIRVSTADQCEDRQIISMQDKGIPLDNIYIDKQSGKDFERSAYKLLMKKLRTGDLLYIKSIDRLGRNYDEIQNQWRFLTREKSIDIVVIDIPLLDTRINKDLIGTLIADLVLQILSYVAHSEHDTIRQRQAEGIRAARARGVHLGRPVKKPSENFIDVVKMWERGKLPFLMALEQTGLTESTFYRRLREYRIATNRKQTVIR